MPIHNRDIAGMLVKLADLLEIQGANPFRVRAYRDAAHLIEELPESIAEMVRDGRDLTELRGIGKAIAAKIQEIVETGELHQLTELTQEIPEQVTRLLDVTGLGPKRVAALYHELGIVTLKQLMEAAQAQRIRHVAGFGPVLEKQLLEYVQQMAVESQRFPWLVGEQVGAPLLAFLSALEQVDQAAIAGSFRRCQATLGDLDLVVSSAQAHQVMERLRSYEAVRSVLLGGDTRTSLVLDSGMQVDVRVVPAESYGAALCYFTGSKAHGIALRDRALDRGLKLNEYGLYRDVERIAGETEAELYAALDLDYIPPELREDRGEIGAAERHDLPTLIALEDIRGDLQAHTQASDGHDSLEAMAAAAEARGYEYLAITDHSQYVGITHGLDAERLLQQIEAIESLNARSRNLTLLKGIEVDIREDGSLALPDDVLARLDIVVCAVHTQLGLQEDAQTKRILRAIESPYCHVLAHPTARLIGKRAPLQVDMARIVEAARLHGCALEINADPSRLDLDGVHCRMAKEAGVKLVISTDAHRETGLDHMRLGVGQARRGWLEATDVLNTLPLADLRRALRKRNP